MLKRKRNNATSLNLKIIILVLYLFSFQFFCIYLFLNSKLLKYFKNFKVFKNVFVLQILNSFWRDSPISLFVSLISDNFR